MLAINVECYSNYYSVAFSNNYVYEVHNDVVTMGDLDHVKELFLRGETIGYNSKAYDLPMLHCILQGGDCDSVYAINQRLTVGDERLYPNWGEIDESLAYSSPNHIDLMHSFKASDGGKSLAIIACKANCKTILNLNLKLRQTIENADQCKQIRVYNVQNCLHTLAAYKVCKQTIDLKEYLSKEFGHDFRSMAFEAIAEWIVRKKCNIKKIEVGLEDYEVNYVKPDYIDYDLDIPPYVYTATEKSKALKLPAQTINGKTYKIGIGGIHSQEKSDYIPYDEDYEIVDIDATSYYIYIILNNNLTFMRAGDVVRTVLEEWLDIRVKAKQAKDKQRDSAYKLLILSMFGKTGSPYSIFFSPSTFGFITITGQLQLLDLITKLEAAGISVESANTDGILTRCHKSLASKRDEIVKDFEKRTKHTMEYTRFRCIARESVGQYVAIGLDGSIKGKGCYADGSFHPLGFKGDNNRVVSDAVCNYLANGVQVADYINNCDNLLHFMLFKRANGSGYAVDTGERLGKVVRFYFSKTRATAIRNHDNGNLVAGTDGCCPALDLRHVTIDDVNRDWYIEQANEKLRRLGVLPKISKKKVKKTDDVAQFSIFDVI